MKKKSIVAVVVALIMALALCIPLAACDLGNYSETFTGTLSTNSYASEESAVKAFLDEEIASDETVVSYKSSQKTADLTAEEIEALDISVEEGTVEGVQKWTVGYSKTNGVSKMSADEQDDLSYVTVYVVIIKTSSQGTTVDVYEYRYYVPLPENGEAVSRSYFESVFDNEKYQNCTFTYSMTSTSKVLFIKQTMTIDYKMYITEDAVMIDATVKMPQEDGSSTTDKITYYFVQSGSTVKGAKIVNDNISSASLSYDFGVYDISDLYSSQMDDALYSFFVKTEYGFKMNEEKLGDLVDEALEVAGSGSDIDFGKSNAKYEFYVSEGRLDHAVYNVKVDCKYEGVSMNVSVDQKFNYSAFGTTTVTIPENVSSYLN